MSKYSYLNIIKSRCKYYSREHGLSLNATLEMAAKNVGFTSFHDLSQVSKSNPHDVRLMRIAFEFNKLEDAIYEGDILQKLDLIVENEMSGAMAETNATFFMIENLVPENAVYDCTNGHVKLEINFDWQGEQNEDRPWSGSEFNIDAIVTLVYRSNEWKLHHQDGLEIIHYDSDFDRQSYFK